MLARHSPGGVAGAACGTAADISSARSGPRRPRCAKLIRSLTVESLVQLSTSHAGARGLSPGAHELSLKGHDAAHGVGTWRNVLIAVWRTETTPRAVAGVSKVLGELVKRHAEVAILQVVEADASAPDSDARRALSDMLSRHSAS